MYRLQPNMSFQPFIYKYGILSWNVERLLWVLSCGHGWNRFLCDFGTMAYLRGPVLRSNGSTCGSSCSTLRQSSSQSQRSCKPYEPSRPKRWRRWSLVTVSYTLDITRVLSNLVYFSLKSWSFIAPVQLNNLSYISEMGKGQGPFPRTACQWSWLFVC